MLSPWIELSSDTKNGGIQLIMDVIWIFCGAVLWNWVYYFDHQSLEKEVIQAE